MGEAVVGRIELHGVHGEGRFALVSLCDLDQLSQYNWFVHHEGYAIATIDGEQIYMHRLIIDSQGIEDKEVDHINRNRLDNTRSNLRPVNRSQNCCNAAKRYVPDGFGRLPTSMFKGVSWNKKYQKWYSQIQVNRKQYFLGSFDDEIQAALAYDRKSRELHGQFGVRNFPDPPVQPVINITNNYYSGPPNY